MSELIPHEVRFKKLLDRDQHMVFKTPVERDKHNIKMIRAEIKVRMFYNKQDKIKHTFDLRKAAREGNMNPRELKAYILSIFNIESEFFDKDSQDDKRI